MTIATKRLLVGRMIVGFELRSFDGGGNVETRTCHDPIFILDNGARVTFTVEETESGDGYGVHPNYHPKQG